MFWLQKEVRLVLGLKNNFLINILIRNYHIRVQNVQIKVLEVCILKNNNQHHKREKDNLNCNNSSLKEVVQKHHKKEKDQLAECRIINFEGIREIKITKRSVE